MAERISQIGKLHDVPFQGKLTEQKYIKANHRGDQTQYSIEKYTPKKWEIYATKILKGRRPSERNTRASQIFPPSGKCWKCFNQYSIVISLYAHKPYKALVGAFNAITQTKIMNWLVK